MIAYSTFRNVADRHPIMNALPSWEAFADHLEAESEREGTEKLRTACISPAIYDFGATRAKANVLGWQWFAADIDNKPVNQDHSTIDAVGEKLFAENCPFVIYTTSSHSPDAHRFRVMFPLDRMIEPHEFAEVWASMAAWLGCCDAQTKDESRLFVAPRAWAGSLFFRHDEGEPVCLDLMKIANPVAIPQHKPSRRLTSAFCDMDGLRPVEYGDLSLHGPLTSPEIIARSSTGDGRMFRFMVSTGKRALIKGYAITADDLQTIGLDFASSIGRSADANRDIGRDAENAHRAAVSAYAEWKANRVTAQCPVKKKIAGYLAKKAGAL